MPHIAQLPQFVYYIGYGVAGLVVILLGLLGILKLRNRNRFGGK